MSRPTLPAGKVSRNRKVGQGRAVEVKVAIIRTEGDMIQCSCQAWAKVHPRAKVREEAAQRHLDRRHGGVGMWF